MASGPAKAAELLRPAEEEVLAYMAFPNQPWTRICSTNPLEWPNKKIEPHTHVVGICPEVASVERLVGGGDDAYPWRVAGLWWAQRIHGPALPWPGVDAQADRTRLRLTAPLHLEPIR